MYSTTSSPSPPCAVVRKRRRPSTRCRWVSTQWSWRDKREPIMTRSKSTVLCSILLQYYFDLHKTVLDTLGRCLFSLCWVGLFWRFSSNAFMPDTSSRSSATTCGRLLNVSGSLFICIHDPLVESCCKEPRYESEGKPLFCNWCITKYSRSWALF